MTILKHQRSIYAFQRTTWEKSNDQDSMEDAPKEEKVAFETKSSNINDSVKDVKQGQARKRPIKQRSFPPLSPIEKSKNGKVVQNEDEDMAIKSFNSGSGEELNIICNMI